jgi:hypothetical protein
LQESLVGREDTGNIQLFRERHLKNPTALRSFYAVPEHAQKIKTWKNRETGIPALRARSPKAWH